MKVITKYITLYIKSIKFIWKSCKFLTIAMIALIPIQALMPSATLYLTNIIINKVQENDIKQISLFVILWCVVFVLNNIMPPINVFIQGQLTDKLTYYLNFSVMKKAEEIQDLSHYEDAEFYNEIKLISSEASWRPVNLLVFGSSIISNSIIFISMVCMLASFQIWIAIVIFIAMIVQGWIAYKIQQQSFETLVSNTEDSRKLSYYSESVLNADYIKDIRLYSLHSFFQNKYKCTYEEIRKKVQKNRIKQFVGATIFLIVCAIFGAFCFNFVINSVIDNVYKLGVIMVFVSTIGYSIQSVTILVQDTSLLYDTLLYMEKVFCYLKIKDVGYEGQDLGGALKPAGVPHFKQADRDLVAWYAATLAHLGVDVRLNTRADKALLDSLKPQTVFVAEGSTPRTLALPGADGDNVVSALDVLEGKAKAGKSVVIIGAGLVACELALHLVQNGHTVTLLARRKLLRSAKLPAMNELMLRDLLVFHGVHIVEGAALESVDAKGVYYEVEGVPALAEGDTVITAVGMEANHALFDAIRDDYETVLALGDGRRVRNIFGAIWDGYEAARSL